MTTVTPTAANFATARALGTDDDHADAPSTTLYLHADMARLLLEARGWTLEPQIGGGFAYVLPGGKLRGKGGQFGTDYLWERDDALMLAMRAEAVALGFEA